VLEYQGLPDDLVLGVYAPASIAVHVPALRGTLAVPPAGLQVELFGTAAADGSLTTSVPIPTVNGVAAALTLQAAAFVPQQGPTLSASSALLVLAP